MNLSNIMSMNLSNIIKGLLIGQKKLDVKKLPSQGFFYKNDFEISIKKANIEDIVDYEFGYDKENITIVLSKIKKIVENNTILSKEYSYDDIKNIDVIFLFIEIVKLTNNKPITLSFFNDLIGKEDMINFDSTTFNYFNPNELMENYDEITREFIIDGYRYSMASIGVENSLTQFFLSVAYTPNAEMYNNYNYDFIYFLGNKSNLTFNDIENLIQIFNVEMEDVEREKISNIVSMFAHLGKYSLKRNSQIIEINSKIKLDNIWK